MISYDVGVSFTYSQRPLEWRKRMKTRFFLCIRESVSNALTNAKASRIDVNYTVISDELLHLRISDDGVGVHPNEVFDAPSRLGLAMIRERTEGISGRTDIVSDQD